MSKLTAMQELIEKLINLSNSTYFNGKKTDCDIIDRIMLIAKNEFLEKEKQQIIEAYSEAETEMSKRFSSDMHKWKNSETYYNETFNNK